MMTFRPSRIIRLLLTSRWPVLPGIPFLFAMAFFMASEGPLALSSGIALAGIGAWGVRRNLNLRIEIDGSDVRIFNPLRNYRLVLDASTVVHARLLFAWPFPTTIALEFRTAGKKVVAVATGFLTNGQMDDVRKELVRASAAYGIRLDRVDEWENSWFK